MENISPLSHFEFKDTGNSHTVQSNTRDRKNIKRTDKVPKPTQVNIKNQNQPWPAAFRPNLDKQSIILTKSKQPENLTMSVFKN